MPRQPSSYLQPGCPLCGAKSCSKERFPQLRVAGIVLLVVGAVIGLIIILSLDFTGRPGPGGLGREVAGGISGTVQFGGAVVLLLVVCGALLTALAPVRWRCKACSGEFDRPTYD